MNKQRIVIIGAVALGPKVACRLKRLRPDFSVTMVDQDEYISYGGCGIPYYISGDLSDIKELMSTSFHMLRTPDFFEDAKDVRVMTRTRALGIDRRAKTVRLRRLDTGLEEDLPYDKLVLATGSRARRLEVPGGDLPQVMRVANLRDALAVREKIAQGQVAKAVIIGAGALGLEMAEALGDLWGVETTMVEIAPQVLPGVLDPGLARMVLKNLEDHDVTVHLQEKVREIRAGEGEHALQVVTANRVLEADLVLTALGVMPNSQLAADSGLAVSPQGGIVVNPRLQTSDPDIFAGGDCIENTHLLTGKRVYFPSGSLANRQGRVIGTNLAGGDAVFPGIVGSFTVKIFNMAVAATGLSLAAALAEGLDAVSALVIQADRAHFFPGQDLMYLQLVVEKMTRRLLGAQGLGSNGDALVGRVNSIAALLSRGALLEELSNLEVAYSPPFAAALDIVNATANTAENILDGFNRTVDVAEFEKCFLTEQAGDLVCLDVRGAANAAPYVDLFGARWLNIPQETLKDRLAEIPADKRLIVVCNSGVRSYEALRQLETAGLCNAVNLQGGVAALKKSGLLGSEEKEDRD
ncbi:MAG: pyridine nucleotide-disulfide oxidoreductase [Deltaproteobacteria bacterium]|nr:MAG: pyridine nucleotide-disulfide oxidoreductase [Deltaproteobacteria bacterium]